MAAWMLPERIRQWTIWISEALGRRSRKYWLPILIGVPFAHGRRISSWWFTTPRADDDRRDHCDFRSCPARRYGPVAVELPGWAGEWLTAWLEKLSLLWSTVRMRSVHCWSRLWQRASFS